ncbi:hypothetical protein HMPREF9997_02849 [Corynebacterium durum F0235]|uniref:Uncharacterized protein n=1 Tax=Corynebacterium durum F0235 TaxID=1035195 RepID=L1M8E3_9CORY|nr:hypothetical protein HMPREF9997_02849 [Corynebacterium durum F0235]
MVTAALVRVPRTLTAPQWCSTQQHVMLKHVVLTTGKHPPFYVFQRRFPPPAGHSEYSTPCL